MNLYRHIAISTREYHEGLMAWCRRLLSEAGLENLEVYGQMPARGLTSSHLVFFPYRMGPEPKVQENAPGTSLLRPRVPLQPGHPFVPDVWIELGVAMAEAIELAFPSGAGKDSNQRHSNVYYPAIQSLPEPLRRWYNQAPVVEGDSWTVEGPGGGYARPPSLGWRSGLPAVVRYIVLAHEPGRGADERTSASPPVALSALNVILAAVHRERTVVVEVPPLPVSESLLSYIAALAEASPPEVGARLKVSLDAIRSPMKEQIAAVLIQDLNNRELIALMQALQRPLQTSLNMQVRYTLGSEPVFGPSSYVAIQPLKPPPRGQSV